MAKKKTTKKAGIAKVTKDARFELRMSPDLKERASKKAKSEGRPLANWITHLIDQNC
ncbi:MAG: toxin-antitoxin system HicB family antitoxin [Flavobacteriales bacterium]|nr:toxin-antitoxin system HicB family antitoxin [Flavobacteriales bacterium]